MAIQITFHGGNLPPQRDGRSVEAPGAQIGAAVAVADAAVSSAFDNSGIYRIKATTASVVRIGESLSDAAGGETWAADEKEYRYIAAGEVVACDAG